MKAKLIILSLVLFLSVIPQQKEKVFVGSKNSNKYHLPSCRYVKKISTKNYREFKSIKETEASGYKPCKVCKPEAK